MTIPHKIIENCLKIQTGIDSIIFVGTRHRNFTRNLNTLTWILWDQIQITIRDSRICAILYGSIFYDVFNSCFNSSCTMWVYSDQWIVDIRKYNSTFIQAVMNMEFIEFVRSSNLELLSNVESILIRFDTGPTQSKYKLLNKIVTSFYKNPFSKLLILL